MSSVSTVILINGYPGVGKYTVAIQLSKKLPGSKLIHNHLVVDLARSLLSKESCNYRQLRNGLREYILTFLGRKISRGNNSRDHLREGENPVSRENERTISSEGVDKISQEDDGDPLREGGGTLSQAQDNLLVQLTRSLLDHDDADYWIFHNGLRERILGFVSQNHSQEDKLQASRERGGDLSKDVAESLSWEAGEDLWRKSGEDLSREGTSGSASAYIFTDLATNLKLPDIDGMQTLNDYASMVSFPARFHHYILSPDEEENIGRLTCDDRASNPGKLTDANLLKSIRRDWDPVFFGTGPHTGTQLELNTTKMSATDVATLIKECMEWTSCSNFGGD